MIEDRFPESFKRAAYHPSAFVFAWKRKDLEKLFDELNLSNIAIKVMEVWIVEDVPDRLVPLKNGNILTFVHKNFRQKDEEWSDFVERSIKETTDFINDNNLEKNVVPDKVNYLWYHFEFIED